MKNPRRRQPQRRNRGVMLVWFALFGMAFVLLIALAGDSAHIYLAGHQLQNGADAAALAGAWEVRDAAPTAHDRAIAVAAANRGGGANVQLAANLGNTAGGDVVIGYYDLGANTFTPTFTSPNAVKVVARRTSGSPGGALPLIFGPALGFSSSDVSRDAIAVVGGPSIGAGLILLNRESPGSATLTGTGNAVKINIPNGAVQINSNSAEALDWTGSPTIIASALFVGGINDPDPSSIVEGGEVTLNAPPVEDPLRNLPVPEQGPTQNPPQSQTVLQPGYYGNNKFPTNRDVILEEGIYFIDGGIRMTGGRTIDARAGCMIFLNTGGIEMLGGSELLINAPTSGTYAGIAVYQRRGNTSESFLQGNPETENSGTFYFPSAHVTVAGNPAAFGSQLIADTLHVQGNGELNLSYDGRFQIQGHRIFLVE